MALKIVTFYTSQYSHLARMMVDSARTFGYDVVEEQIESTGTWAGNTNKKALVVYKHLTQGEPFIITDADSEITRTIDESIFSNCEMSARYKGNEFLSGTMFFRPCKAVFEVVANWSWRINREPRILEQLHLQKAVEEKTFGFKNLPDSYCTIFDEYPAIEKPVFLHHQASRQFRGKVVA